MANKNYLRQFTYTKFRNIIIGLPDSGPIGTPLLLTLDLKTASLWASGYTHPSSDFHSSAVQRFERFLRMRLPPSSGNSFTLPRQVAVIVVVLALYALSVKFVELAPSRGFRQSFRRGTWLKHIP